MPRTVAIIQARMGSTRLPGKCLADIAGRPMLEWVVRRARAAPHLDQVAVATSTFPADDGIGELCIRLGVKCYRGSPYDVLDRYFHAALWLSADYVVRLTADCPLLDPLVIGDAVIELVQGRYDYVSNVDPPTYPDGLDVEAMCFGALSQAHQEAREAEEREHVTLYIRRHPELFNMRTISCHLGDLSQDRWTVDYAKDLEFMREVYKLLPRDDYHMSTVLALLRERPEMRLINAGVYRE